MRITKPWFERCRSGALPPACLSPSSRTNSSTRAMRRLSSVRSSASSVIGLQWWKCQVFGPVEPIGLRALKSESDSSRLM